MFINIFKLSVIGQNRLRFFSKVLQIEFSRRIWSNLGKSQKTAKMRFCGKNCAYKIFSKKSLAIVYYVLLSTITPNFIILRIIPFLKFSTFLVENLIKKTFLFVLT